MTAPTGVQSCVSRDYRARSGIYLQREPDVAAAVERAVVLLSVEHPLVRHYLGVRATCRCQNAFFACKDRGEVRPCGPQCARVRPPVASSLRWLNREAGTE